MKKFLPFVFLALFCTAKTQAQCTIQQSCTPTGVWCTTPALNSALPGATETVAYSTTIQITLNTVAAGNTINSGTITAVTGLPAGLSYSTNPANGVINGGGSGCILIAGTPAVGAAGNYTVTANMNISTSFGLIPGTFNWTLSVVSTAGMASNQAMMTAISIVPNPAAEAISVLSEFPFRSVKICDALGNVVLRQDNNLSVNGNIQLGKLTPGIYFLQLSDGTRVATRKFIKE